MISQKNKGWSNPWVIGIGVFILTGVSLTSHMVWTAFNNPARLLDENYSVKGHNQYDAKWVQQQAERSTLGWRAKLHSPQQLANDPLAAESALRFVLTASRAQFKLELSNRDGKPVQGGQVTINSQWPGAPEFDTGATLHEAAPGIYEGAVNFSRPGNWDVLIKAQHQGSLFEMEQRIFVAIEGKS